MNPKLWLLLIFSALLACKGSEKSAASTAAPAATPAPPPPKLPYRPSVSELEKVCAGQGVPNIEPQPRDKARAALFVKSDPAGKLEHVPYESVVAYKDGLAVSLEDASLVACIEVTKKKKLTTCEMKPLDPSKMGGTLTTYGWDYVVRLRDTKTGKVLSEKKITRADKKCPSLHSFKQLEEDLLPPFETGASLAVSNYRDGK
ncbi:MAG: hypothetical protein HS104_19690 [Polyangiaceae bacterium]|nr:hypothetical protein [Polyangiaceae bacterium]MCE7889080.1 hypothetical protein [Sorangiineae bacterium PRO1]MCL4755585.1 hypothetical protein [Myxococcales bacterium]